MRQLKQKIQTPRKNKILGEIPFMGITGIAVSIIAFISTLLIYPTSGFSTIILAGLGIFGVNMVLFPVLIISVISIIGALFYRYRGLKEEWNVELKEKYLANPKQEFFGNSDMHDDSFYWSLTVRIAIILALLALTSYLFPLFVGASIASSSIMYTTTAVLSLVLIPLHNFVNFLLNAEFKGTISEELKEQWEEEKSGEYQWQCTTKNSFDSTCDSTDDQSQSTSQDINDDSDQSQSTWQDMNDYSDQSQSTWQDMNDYSDQSQSTLQDINDDSDQSQSTLQDINDYSESNAEFVTSDNSNRSTNSLSFINQSNGSQKANFIPKTATNPNKFPSTATKNETTKQKELTNKQIVKSSFFEGTHNKSNFSNDKNSIGSIDGANKGRELSDDESANEYSLSTNSSDSSSLGTQPKPSSYHISSKV